MLVRQAQTFRISSNPISSMIEVHCDLTAPADYISEIGGNNTVENLREHFTGALQTVNKKLSLITNTLAVFAYDVCSSTTTTGGKRGDFHWPETFQHDTATLDCPVALEDDLVRYATRHCAEVPRKHNPDLAMAEWAAPNITACPTPSTAALQQLSKVEFNASLPEKVLSTSITVASLTNNTEELTTDAVDFASTAIFNLVAAVSKDEVLNQTVGKEIVQSTLKTVDNILSVNSDAKVVMSAPAKRLAKSMERLVSTVTVEVNEPFQEQQENIAFAVSCPVNSFSTQAFRSKSPGGFFLGETNASATMTRFGVAF
eukprot:scpid94870/ scgid5774/ 